MRHLAILVLFAAANPAHALTCVQADDNNPETHASLAIVADDGIFNYETFDGSTASLPLSCVRLAPEGFLCARSFRSESATASEHFLLRKNDEWRLMITTFAADAPAIAASGRNYGNVQIMHMDCN